jgi:phage N-6-adenine-methyltransferase
MSVHFSSLTDLWPTPQSTFDALDREFGFETDVCAIASNAKCGHYFSPEMDGLAQDWRGVCWMNPPYGRSISKWMRKAYESSLQGSTVVCLVPARTDTAWWHDYAMLGEIRFIRGRLQFNGVKDAPFPSAVVVFSAKADRSPKGQDRETGLGSRERRSRSDLPTLSRNPPGEQ